MSPTWMIMEFAGFQSKSPMLYLFRKDQKDVIEWGEEFNVTQLQDHINVTGHLEGTKSFLQLDFNKVACGDGGRYTCSYGGLDKHGRLRKYSMSGDFIAQSLYKYIYRYKFIRNVSSRKCSLIYSMYLYEQVLMSFRNTE